MRITHLAGAATIAVSLLAPAVQAGMFVYPAKGQSPQKQAEDEGTCHQWGKGAAIGSAVGATAGLFRHRRQMREQQQYNQAVSNEQKCPAA